METRYTIDSSDRVRVWNCWVGVNDEGSHGMFTSDGLQDGKMKDPTFKIAEEKNVGRANYLTCEDQAIVMVEQACGKKERKNYFKTIEEARSLKLFKPMLAHKYESFDGNFPVHSQPKLDGARCNVYWCYIAEKVVIRTRSTKDYFSVPHILEELKALCTNNKSLVFDGELYMHDLHSDFEKMMSLVKKTKPTAEELTESAKIVEYHVYDLYDRVDPDRTFNERTTMIRDIFKENVFSKVMEVPTLSCYSQEDLDSLQDEYLENSYEGQMVRSIYSTYKVDGRSKDLLKRKNFITEEFEIVSIEEGTGQWVGRAKTVKVLLPNGNICGCGTRGSFSYTEDILKDKDKYIGKLATVRYFRYTKDSMLYIPVVIDYNRFDL